MERRQYLATLGALTTVTAGCSSDDGDSEGDEGPAQEQQTPTPTSTPSPTATPIPTAEGPPTHEIGNSFTVGEGAKSIRYRVTDAFSISDWIGTENFHVEPDGIFLVTVLEIENVGDETMDISTRHLKLADDEGRTFEADTEASSYAVNDERFEAEAMSFEQLQPGLQMTRSVIYDVPTGHSYGLLVEPAGLFSNAESHVVILGSV